MILNDPPPPRYSQRPFPPYRFLSKNEPHPTEHPQGHSYQRFHEASKLIPERWFENEDYLFAVDLYNNGFWWEAHEAWEGLWWQAPPSDLAHHFLQGLIKISAAFLKWHAHNHRGMEQLYIGGMEELRHVCHTQEVYMGLDLMEHIAKLSQHFREVVADESQLAKDPLQNYPFIILKTE